MKLKEIFSPLEELKIGLLVTLNRFKEWMLKRLATLSVYMERERKCVKYSESVMQCAVFEMLEDNLVHITVVY